MEFQVVILAGVHGPMLYPLAETTPKGLLPVANKPVIAYVLEMLEKISDVFGKGIFLATEESAVSSLEGYLASYHSFSANRFEVIGVPHNADGSIGVVRFLAPRIDSDCIVISGDVLMDFQVLDELIRKYRFSDAACTMLLHKNSGAEEGQLFGLNGDRVVTVLQSVEVEEEGVKLRRSLLLKSPRFTLTQEFVDGYVYIFKHWVVDELFTADEIARGGKNSIKNDLLPILLDLAHRPNLVPLSSSASTNEIYVNYVNVPESCFYRRISNVKAYLEANMASCYPITGVGKKGEPQAPLQAALLATMNNPSNIVTSFYANRSLKADAPPIARQISPDSIVGEGLEIGLKASVMKSVLGSRVTIGKDSKVINSVLMDDVVVEPGCVITNSIATAGVVIGSQSKVTNSQLARHCRLPAKSIVKDEVKLG